MQAGSVVDTGARVEELDFSALVGYEEWEVYYVWDGGDDLLARVYWEPAARYLLEAEPTALYIYEHRHIIPAVRTWLIYYQKSDMPAPVVYVSALAD
jgi:hypothetical protein